MKSASLEVVLFCRLTALPAGLEGSADGGGSGGVGSLVGAGGGGAGAGGMGMAAGLLGRGSGLVVCFCQITGEHFIHHQSETKPAG